MRPYDLKDYEVATVLRFFMYYLPMEQRCQLMAEFPVIYNKLCEREIVVSVKKERLDWLNKTSKLFSDEDDCEMGALLKEVGDV